MTDISTLQTINPFSSAKPKEVPIGGRVGFWDEVEQTVELVAKGQGSFVNEATPTTPVEQSLIGFKNARSREDVYPQLTQQEKETNYTNIVYANLEEARRNAQKVAHEPSLHETDLQIEIEAMPEEVWNGKLHLSLDFSKKHTMDKPYYRTEYRRIQKGEQNAVEEAVDNQTAVEVQAPNAFTMRKGELEMGHENVGGHFTTYTS